MQVQLMLLVMDNVWKRYSESRYVLKGVRLTVREGEVVVVSGPNGSGKTTLLKLAAGLLRPSKGKIVIDGREGASSATKKLVGYVPHEPLLYPELTVLENYRYYGGLYGLKEPFESPLAKMAFERLGLEGYASKRVEELSYGWRRRADIVRALLAFPKLLLIDELFTGLDPTGRSRLVEVIKDYVRGGGAVVVTTPVREVDVSSLIMEGLDVRVYELDSGVLVEK